MCPATMPQQGILPMICLVLSYSTRKQLMCKMHGETSLKLAWAGGTSSGPFRTPPTCYAEARYVSRRVSRYGFRDGGSIWRDHMHLKPDPDAVEFLRQFGLLFLFVIVGALYFMRYSSTWSRSKRRHSSKHKHNNEPPKEHKGTSEN